MVRTAAVTAALVFISCGAAAQNGQKLASACAMCHGTQGKPATGAPLIPLAGLPRDHIATQMRAFRDGNRPATVMHQIAKGYTEAQIEAIAAWYAAQPR